MTITNCSIVDTIRNTDCPIVVAIRNFPNQMYGPKNDEQQDLRINRHAVILLKALGSLFLFRGLSNIILSRFSFIPFSFYAFQTLIGHDCLIFAENCYNIKNKKTITLIQSKGVINFLFDLIVNTKSPREILDEQEQKLDVRKEMLQNTLIIPLFKTVLDVWNQFKDSNWSKST